MPDFHCNRIIFKFLTCISNNNTTTRIALLYFPYQFIIIPIIIILSGKTKNDINGQKYGKTIVYRSLASHTIDLTSQRLSNMGHYPLFINRLQL